MGDIPIQSKPCILFHLLHAILWPEHTDPAKMWPINHFAIVASVAIIIQYSNATTE